MAGFTLIELMIVVVVLTLLAAIAIPTYSNQIRKSRRSEAKSALLDLAGREERFMATNGVQLHGFGPGVLRQFPSDHWQRVLQNLDQQCRRGDRPDGHHGWSPRNLHSHRGCPEPGWPDQRHERPGLFR